MECILKIKEMWKKLKDENVGQSLLYLFITIVSVMFPLLYRTLNALHTVDLSKIDLASEFISGNFYLNTVSLLMPIVYVIKCIIKKEYSEKQVKVPFVEAYFAIIIALVGYIITQQEVESLSVPVTAVISSVLFFWAITIAYRIHIFESVSKEMPDDIRKRNEMAIENSMGVIASGKQSKTIKRQGIEGTLDIEFDETEEL